MTSQAASTSSGMPSDAGEVVAAAARQDAHDGVRVPAQNVRDGARQPVAAEDDRGLAGGGSAARQLLRMVEVARQLGVVLDAERAQARLHRRQDLGRAASAGGWVDDERDHARTRSARVVAQGDGVVGSLAAHQRAVELGRLGAGEVGVRAVADHERPPGPETVQRGAEDAPATACRS